MKTYKVDFTKTGWQEIPTNTHTIIAHYKDGSKKVYEITEFIVLGKQEKSKIVQIDCYKRSERIPEK